MLNYSLLAISCFTYFFTVVIYRLFFHPLHRFPGPKLAAVTFLYDFYFSVIKDGMFIWEIERMHRKYGPVVRITPDELHVNDTSFYNEIYTSGSRKRNKYLPFTRFFGVPRSMLTTIDHDHHQLRRKLLNNFFSKRSISNAQSLIQDGVEKLVKQLENAYQTGAVVNLDEAFSDMTTDIISQYSYGFQFSNDFKNSFRDSILALASAGHLLRFLPFDLSILKKVPVGILQSLNPNVTKALRLRVMMNQKSVEALRAREHGSGDATIFHALTDPSVPAKERTIDRLEDEGAVLISAGTETTTRVLSIIVYYLLNDEVLLSRLRNEIKTIMPMPSSCPSWYELEGLPLLKAVINEGLRLSFCSLTRFPRIAPDENLRYKEWIIPAGTAISGSTYFVHADPEIFPNPHSFKPERWMPSSGKEMHPEAMIFSFGKGSRQCIGINLAYAELYLATAHLVRRVRMELRDTTLDDIEAYRDRVLVVPKNGFRGIRAVVTGISSS